MADKKEKSLGWNFDTTELFFLFIFLLAIFSTIVPALLSYITSGEITFYGFKFSSIFEFFKSNVWLFKILGFAIAGISAVGIFVFNKRTDAVWREIKANLYPPDIKESLSDVEKTKNPMKERWEKIVELSESKNPSDWRLAIVEADIILDELLEKLHLPGDTMGEKLKAVEKSDFTTIENAWEAHKVRNMIAHEGSNFIINQHEIRRVVSLYKSVFEEFSLI